MELLGFFAPTWLLIVLWSLGLILAWYIYCTWNHGLFKSLGIEGPKPGLLGNIDLFGKYGFVNLDIELGKQYGKIYGMYEGTIPTLVVGDSAVLRKLMISDFSTFPDRRILYLRGWLKASIFDARGAQWKHTRRLLTPGFTTGKLKQMTEAIESTSDILISNMSEHCEENGAFDAKDLVSAYTVDMLTKTILGVDVNSQKDPDNILVKMIKKCLDFSKLNLVYILCLFFNFFFNIFDYFNYNYLANDIEVFFKDFVKRSMEERKKDPGNARSDFLQLMIDANQMIQNADVETKKDLQEADLTQGADTKEGLTQDEIAAQCTIFFFGGYETLASGISFLLYELAANPEIQSKVIEEVDRVCGDGSVAYHMLGECKYLEQCINETLRLHTSLARIDRSSDQDFKINGLTFPKETMIIIPVRAVHMDPEYWPDPDKFDPERHTPEMVAKRQPMSFIPFGEGPRHCIARRLAMMTLKMCTIKILQKHKLELSEKTKMPLTYSTKAIFMTAEGGLWLKLQQRV